MTPPSAACGANATVHSAASKYPHRWRTISSNATMTQSPQLHLTRENPLRFRLPVETSHLLRLIAAGMASSAVRELDTSQIAGEGRTRRSNRD